MHCAKFKYKMAPAASRFDVSVIFQVCLTYVARPSNLVQEGLDFQALSSKLLFVTSGKHFNRGFGEEEPLWTYIIQLLEQSRDPANGHVETGVHARAARRFWSSQLRRCPPSRLHVTDDIAIPPSSIRDGLHTSTCYWNL